MQARRREREASATPLPRTPSLLDGNPTITQPSVPMVARGSEVEAQ
eukprot:COSAG01_NODE_26247_length_720_cov_0.544283_1_plen_45_part_10